MTQGYWYDWSGYKAASIIQDQELEYFAIRSTTSLFDISPLIKYRIKGKDTEKFLNKLTVRNVILQKNNSRWHTDSSYRYLPSIFSILYGQETLPPKAVGGQTQFSNMLLAYDHLPEDKKILLEPLHQVHSYNDIRRLEPGLPELTYEEKSNFPPVTHPIVRVHPDRNFRKSLYFTSNTSLEIGGMSLEQGKELHKWLVNYISQPKFCYTHKWQKNDLIMWDNRVLLHRVIPYDYAKYRRAMIRGTVEAVSYTHLTLPTRS